MTGRNLSASFHLSVSHDNHISWRRCPLIDDFSDLNFCLHDSFLKSHLLFRSRSLLTRWLMVSLLSLSYASSPTIDLVRCACVCFERKFRSRLLLFDSSWPVHPRKLFLNDVTAEQQLSLHRFGGSGPHVASHSYIRLPCNPS